MPDIIIKDEFGEDEVYEGVNTVRFRATDGTLAQFSAPGYDVESIIDGSVMTINSNAANVMPYAFLNRKNLVSVNLPKAETIGLEACAGCSELTAFIAPNATTLQTDALKGCYKLEELYLPSFRSGSIYYTGFSNLKNVTLGALPSSLADDFNPKNNITVPSTSVLSWQLYNSVHKQKYFRTPNGKNVKKYKSGYVNSASMSSTFSIEAEAGDTIVFFTAHRGAIETAPDSFVHMVTDPPYGSSNQQLSMFYSVVDESGSKDYTFTFPAQTPFYYSYVILANVLSVTRSGRYFVRSENGSYDQALPTKNAGENLIIGCSADYWATTADYYWLTEPANLQSVQRFSNGNATRCGMFLDFEEPTSRMIRGSRTTEGYGVTGTTNIQIDALEIVFKGE